MAVGKLRSAVLASLLLYGFELACSAEVPWDVDYQADKMPTEAIAGVEVQGTTDAVSCEKGFLAFHDGVLFLTKKIDAYNSTGITLEARLKVDRTRDQSRFELYVSDRHATEALNITDRRIGTYYSHIYYDMNTGDDFHVYRLAARGDDLRVYVDGRLVINGKRAYLGRRAYHYRGHDANAIRFGGYRMHGWMDYVRFTAKGAYAPDGSVETFPAQPSAGKVIPPEPLQYLVDRVDATLRADDPKVPKLGGPVDAPVLFEDETLQVWLAPTMHKVMQHDKVKAGRPAANEVGLALARNEFEPVQVVLRPKGAPLERVSLEFSDLVGKSGTIGREHLQYHPVGYVANLPTPSMRGRTLEKKGNRFVPRQVGPKGYWPDPLVPRSVFDAKDSRNYPVWITLHAPADASAGDYEGTVTIRSQRANDIVLKLKVRVWDFAIPKTHRLLNTTEFYAGWFTRMITPEVMQGYYKFLAQHRVVPIYIWPLPKVEVRDGKVTIDREANKLWLEMNRYCIDELGMNKTYYPLMARHGQDLGQELHGNAAHNRHFKTFLGVKMYDETGNRFTEQYRDILTQYVKAMSALLKDEGLYQHRNLGWTMNELTTEYLPERYRIVADFCDIVKAADPDIKMVVSMATPGDPEQVEMLTGRVDVWCENARNFNSQYYDRLRAQRNQFFLYWNGSECFEEKLDVVRIHGWIMWAKNLQGYFYDTGGIIRGGPGDFWVRPYYRWFDGIVSWGQGCFIYPNETLTGFESCIRFELQRDGFEDYESWRINKAAAGAGASVGGEDG